MKKKFVYIVADVKPIELPNELHEFGSNGWELVSILPMIKSKPAISNVNGTAITEIMFQIIFKSVIDE